MAGQVPIAVGVAISVNQCFDSGKYSDLTISCGATHEFRVHRMIVCPQSEYFAKAVDEGRFKEGQTGVIELPPADDPEAIKALVSFLYTGDYDCPGQNPFQPIPATEESTFETPLTRPRRNDWGYRGKKAPSFVAAEDKNGSTTTFTFDVIAGQQHPLLFHLSVYEVADRIQQTKLKTLAENKFERTLKSYWNHDKFVDTVRKVYDIPPPGTHGDKLRKIILEVSAENAATLFKKESFSGMVREVHDFAADLSAALCGHESLNYGGGKEGTRQGDKDQDLEEFNCEGCANRFMIDVPNFQMHLSCPVCTASRPLTQWREYNLYC